MKNETARKPAKILQFQVDFYERVDAWSEVLQQSTHLRG